MSQFQVPALLPPCLSALLRLSLRIGIAPVLLAAGSGLEPLRAQQTTPYAAVVIWTGMGRCYSQYGVASLEKAAQSVIDLARKQYGMEPDQVLNLIRSPDFQRDVSAFISKEGGCRAIVDALKAAKPARP
jgi:hypothetical protein